VADDHLELVADPEIVPKDVDHRLVDRAAAEQLQLVDDQNEPADDVRNSDDVQTKPLL